MVGTEHCPFCLSAADWQEAMRFVYAHARCSCGAIGVDFGIPADADEGADELLAVLALEPLPAVQPVPVGTSGMISAVPYNTPRTLADLEALLRRHRYALEVVKGHSDRGSPRWAMWARPDATAS